jgi:hypothetical protein
MRLPNTKKEVIWLGIENALAVARKLKDRMVFSSIMMVSHGIWVV